MATQEDVLKTIETLKEEIVSLQSSRDTEKKLFRIAHIVERWFLDTSRFYMDDSRPDFDSVRKSICDSTIDDIISRALDTYNAFYDIVEIIDILHED